MGMTVINHNSALTEKKWGGALFNSTIASSFWLSRMTENARLVENDAEQANAPVVVLNHLEKNKGDTIQYDLWMQISGTAVYGDDTLEGNEINLDAYSDNIVINQVRFAVQVPGKMSQKRVSTNLRNVAKIKLKELLAKYIDQLHFMNLAGARGVSTSYDFPLGIDEGVKGTHKFTDYDADHILYGGNATSKGTLTASDTMKLTTVERAVTKAKVEGGGADMKTRLDPLTKNGYEEAFILVMNTYQAHDLRADAGTKGWFDIQKAAATAEGKKSNIFSGELGWYRGVCLKEHKDVVQFDNYGAGGNIKAARAGFLGRQALVTAFGNAASRSEKLRTEWKEESKDYGNKTGISAGFIMNVKRPEFNGQTYGSMAIDTAHTSGTATVIT